MKRGRKKDQHERYRRNSRNSYKATVGDTVLIVLNWQELPSTHTIPKAGRYLQDRRLAAAMQIPFLTAN